MTDWPTSFTDAEGAADTPFTQAKAQKIGDAIDYLRERMVLSGTELDSNGGGQRIAIAFGSEDFGDTGIVTNRNFSITSVSFSSALFNNPSFTTAPQVWAIPLEDAVTGDEWSANTNAWSVLITDVSTTEFSAEVKFVNGSGIDIFGSLWWLAIGTIA